MEKDLFSELCITPNNLTNVEHRLTDCNPYYGATWSKDAEALSLAGAYLPLFTAPMACVVDENNYLEFDKNNINPIIPRTVPYKKRLELMFKQVWIAVGLEEFNTIINTFDTFTDDVYICVDVANGHMTKLLNLCKKAKYKFNNLTLMAGNIAYHHTYEEYAKAGIDYVRVSIGSGSGCCTNTITGIGTSPFDLLCNLVWDRKTVYKTYNSLSNKYKSVPYIVFDGGCKSIRDIIIALALGADYVMCGKIFAQAKEACGEEILKLMNVTIPNVKKVVYFSECEESDDSNFYYEDVVKQQLVPGRMYYGMSTERAQREMGNTIIKHSEGKEFWVPIEYTLKDWVSQFVAAITSTMSYCNAKSLNEFIGKPLVTNY